MKKVISLIVALLLCVGLACPVFAAAQTFVPSIGYKDGPDIEDAGVHSPCLIVTTIPQAQDKSTDIFQEERDTLLDVYEQLSDGTMKIPIPDNYVIRDLVDVSWKKTVCVDPNHGHKEWLDEVDTQITVTFDMGVPAGVEVLVLTYVDGEWIEAVSVVNNGDGTVTVVFEQVGVVAFCVDRNVNIESPKTGDNIMLFAGLMIASFVAIVVLFIVWRKKRV